MALEENVRRVLIIVIVALLLVSIFGIYIYSMAIIDRWANYKYAPIYKILVNLAIFILSIYSLTKMLRKSA
ncbi:hypothetical protein B6U96_12620 [Archaeoglobales archaeon ex4484_92]|nr:MAG: hypothetical protein B6U96_12620 [Archaeoglobales archaeon ex4484_92]